MQTKKPDPEKIKQEDQEINDDDLKKVIEKNTLQKKVMKKLLDKLNPNIESVNRV